MEESVWGPKPPTRPWPSYCHWKSQCNEGGRGRDRERRNGSAKDVFGVVRVRSLAFWKMDRVTLRGADAFYSPEPLVDFLHEVNFPLWKLL